MPIDNFIKKIMVFIDATEESIAAAMYSIALAKLNESQLIAVYVVDKRSLQELLKAKVFVEVEELEYEKDLEEDGKKYLTYVEKMAKEKDVQVSLFLLKGTVHEEILKKIEEEKVDLLVLSKLEQSVSRLDAFYDENERLLRDAPCPVLVIKNHEEIEELFEQST